MRHPRSPVRRLAALVGAGVALAALSARDSTAEAPRPCRPGQVRSDETEGNCCWAGQGWARDHCVGLATRCPPQSATLGCETEQCEDGQIRMAGGVHCCWPGQTWARSACVGMPQCPEGMAASGATCVGSCPVGMVWLPSGTFREGEWNDWVTVRALCMDAMEVTADAFAACVAQGACSAEGSHGELCNYGAPGRGKHPMNCVSARQSIDYCHAQGKRLPMEEEWEWAARGGSRGTPYPWGNEKPELRTCWDRGVGGTCPVASYPRGDTPSGIHDLAGNVSERTFPSGASTPLLSRGGSWHDPGRAALNATFRSWVSETLRYDELGFRCVQ